MTLLELYNARDTDGELRARITAALWKHATALWANGASTQPQKDWAAYVLTAQNAESKAVNMLPVFLADAAYPFTAEGGDASIQFLVDTRSEAY